MNYTEFKNKFQGSPLILSKDFRKCKKGGQIIFNQLNRWQAKKLIIKLKRGIYLLNKNDRKINPDICFIANQLFWPSYVSLEYALSLYGLIPERVVGVTSVTTKKTMCIENELGQFTYRHIKSGAFRGFRSVKDDSGATFFMAEPEKAVVDYLYFNLRNFKINAKDLFKDSLRFQNLGSLKAKKIVTLARLFKNRSLTRLAGDFCGFIKQEV